MTLVRNLSFGSTTERALRDIFVPVVVTPLDLPAGQSLSDIVRPVSRVLAPVDLTAASRRHVVIAAAVAQALSLPLLIAHVLEPVAIPVRVRLAPPAAGGARRVRAEERMQEILASVAAHVKTDTLVLSGDPVDEIVKITDTRHATLIVMSPHSSELLGPRMGSVTYRVLASTRTPVLALPRTLDAAAA